MTNGEHYQFDRDRLIVATFCGGLACSDCRLRILPPDHGFESEFTRANPDLGYESHCWERFARLEYGVPLDVRQPAVSFHVQDIPDPNPL